MTRSALRPGGNRQQLSQMFLWLRDFFRAGRPDRFALEAFPRHRGFAGLVEGRHDCDRFTGFSRRGITILFVMQQGAGIEKEFVFSIMPARSAISSRIIFNSVPLQCAPRVEDRVASFQTCSVRSSGGAAGLAGDCAGASLAIKQKTRPPARRAELANDSSRGYSRPGNSRSEDIQIRPDIISRSGCARTRHFSRRRAPAPRVSASPYFAIFPNRVATSV